MVTTNRTGRGAATGAGAASRARAGLHGQRLRRGDRRVARGSLPAPCGGTGRTFGGVATALAAFTAGGRPFGCQRLRRAGNGAVAALLLAACSMQPAAPEVTVATVAAAGATHPTVAVDPASGAVYVAWVGVPGADGRADVFLARSDDGGATYAAPIRVNDVPGDAAPHAQAPAQVAVGPDGTVYVVWQNNTKIEGRRFPASDLRLARSRDGGRTFEPAVYVNDDAGGPPASHTFHDVAVLPDGTVLVSWIDGRVRAAAEAAHAGGSGASTGSARNGSPAASGGPAHHGVQGVPEEPSSQIRVARSLDGGRTFGPSVVVAEQACPCCRTSLAVGPAGEVYLAWRAVFAGSIRDVVVARSDDGGRSFRPAIPVHDDGWRLDACPHAGPSLAVDAEGRLHAAWFTGVEGRAGVFHAVSTDGGRSFRGPHALARADVVAPSLAKLDAAGGAVWVAWEDRTGPERRLRVGHARNGGAPRAFDVALGPGVAPALAATDDLAVVVWLEEEAVRSAALRWER